MTDCRWCKHNSYLGIVKDWISCGHPVTLAKQPVFDGGDPAWVRAMSSDRHISRIDVVKECAAFERAAHTSEQ